jgi:gliding motility-associated-like protein
LCDFNAGFFGMTSTSEFLSSVPSIDIVNTSVENTSCGEANGLISVSANGGSGQLEYSIDGTNFQMSNSFENLESGDYTILVRDENGCLSMAEVEIQSSEDLSVFGIETTPSNCGEEDGSIEIIIEDDLALFSLNEGAFTATNLFTNLEAGDYTIVIRNEFGCEVEIDTIVQSDNQNCNINIPNAFSPNGDGMNDVFNILTNPEFEGTISLKIFSRWGELVYTNDNLDLMDGWNGTKNGQAMPSDVYAYLFQITRNNDTEAFSGDVTLIR